MKNYVIFVLCIILSSTVAPPPKISKQYRNDYVYNKDTDAFYKLHIEKVEYWHANKGCEMENAQLMVPASDHDIIQLHSMFKKFPDLGDYVWVNDDGQTHESAEEQAIIDLTPTNGYGENLDHLNQGLMCDVVTRSSDIKTSYCYIRHPFICKVAAQDAPYDERCGVYGKNYKYYSSVSSCYKISRIAITWSQAYTECQAEGAHLLVINSQAEHDAIVNFTNSAENFKDVSYSGLRSYYFFAGFRADKSVGNAPRLFRTIFNQTLEEAGYSEWSATEPNNLSGREFCGSIFTVDGKLNDIDCHQNFGFICEKEVPTSS